MPTQRYVHTCWLTIIASDEEPPSFFKDFMYLILPKEIKRPIRRVKGYHIVDLAGCLLGLPMTKEEALYRSSQEGTEPVFIAREDWKM